MNILSINFGHDASFCFFTNGKLLDFQELERETRRKHHCGITKKLIDAYLLRIGKGLQDIDLVITSATQFWPFDHCDELRIELGSSQRHKDLFGNPNSWQASNFTMVHKSNLENVKQEDMSYYMRMLRDQNLIHSPSWHRKDNSWSQKFLIGLKHKMSDVSSIANNLFNQRPAELNKQKHDYFYPHTIHIGETCLPGLHVDHHTAHAYYATFYSNKASLIITHDGGYPSSRFNSGGIYIFQPNLGVFPLVDPNLELGFIYDKMAAICDVGSAGKLMGLSSYAIPSDGIDQLAENLREQSSSPSLAVTKKIIQKLLDISRNDLRPRYRSLSKFDFQLENKYLMAQAAANVQKLVSRYYADNVGSLCQKFNEVLDGLVDIYLTGGFSLNCPTNSLLNDSFPELSFKPLPAVGDTGQALGAAVAAYDLLGIEVDKQHINKPMSPAFPPTKYNYNYHSQNSVSKHSKIDFLLKISIIVEGLIEGKIFGIHQGRSEVGPRALGRRSIIALASIEGVRDKINKIKGREPWRPLAPICRSEDFYHYFSGDRDACAFMLTTSKVKSNELPAVTHIDNTARVQVIGEENKLLSRVLKELKKRGFPPVIVNTSFNQAGEPIVETVNDALQCATNIGLDALFTENGLFDLNSDLLTPPISAVLHHPLAGQAPLLQSQ